jgi:hypothetical protein
MIVRFCALTSRFTTRITFAMDAPPPLNPADVTSVTSRKTRDERLRILVRGTNRKYYLVPPAVDKNRPDYYVRFEVPRDLRKVDHRLPKTVFRSTGTNMLSAAKLRARDIIEGVISGRWDDAEKLKLRTTCATLGQILDRYRPSPRTVNPVAARRNRNALEMIVRETTGRVSVLDERSDSVLTGKLLRTWMEKRMAATDTDNYLLQERAAVTINSTLAQARSVLSPKVAHLYEGLELPDLSGFRAVRKLKIEADLSYKPLPQICLDAIERDAQLLRDGQSAVAAAAGVTPEEQPPVYLVYLLMSRLGLRNSEAWAARWSWIERRPDGSAELVIERRADFVPKNKRARRQDIDTGLLQELDRFRALPDAWIVPGATRTIRYTICQRLINKWLRPLMPVGREKCAYELRKHAASIIVSRAESEGGGIAAAARFLGDTIATTEQHYGSYLRRVRGIRSDEISMLAFSRQ